MAKSKEIILNKKQIQQKIDRIAYQILEDNIDEQEVVMVGVVPRGYTFAKRLKKVLEKIAAIKVKLVKLELDKEGNSLKAQIDTPVEDCANRVVILVDDVLNSGKTLVYGLGVFLNTPHKKIRTAVLIDRSHKVFPIATDYVGLEIATVLKEHVSVVLDVQGEEDAVYLS